MKTNVILLLLVSFWITGHAQLEINILITKGKKGEIVVRDSGRTVTGDNPSVKLDADRNLIRIINENPDRNYKVIIQGTALDNVSFQRIFEKGELPVNGMELKLDFAKDGKQDRNGSLVFSLPCVVLVQKKEDNGSYSEIGRQPITQSNPDPQVVIDDKNSQNGKPKRILVGIPYYDAITLANSKESNMTTRDFLEILNYYNGKSNEIDLDVLITHFDSNYFLNEFLKSKIDRVVTLKAVPFDKADFDFSQILSSVGGLDVTNIADGFAKFIVKRTRQELNIAFFDKFNTEINKYPDLKTVFPQTCRALSIIGEEIYNYEAYIQTLRESFENDLSTLPAHLPGIIDNHPEFFSKFPGLAATLKSGCYIAEKLKDKVHPGDILADYPVEYLDAFNPDLKASLQTLQLVSASLRDSSLSDSNYWITGRQIKKIILDEETFKIYLGLLYQEAKFKYNTIRFKTTNLLAIFDTVQIYWKDEYPLYKNYFTRFSEKVNKLSSLIHTYKKPRNDSLAIEQYANYFSTSLDFLGFCTEAGQLIPKKFKGEPTVQKYNDLNESFTDYLEIIRSSCQMVLDINRRNYGAAVTNAAHIYDLVYSKYGQRAQDSLEKAGGTLKEAMWANDEARTVLKTENDSAFKAALSQSKYLLKTHPEWVLKKGKDNHSFSPEEINAYRARLIKDTVACDILSKQLIAAGQMHTLFRYGTFMATVVQAKSPEDVEKAIESFALPTGSARIKRETTFNVSLNSYCGLFIGYERIKGIDPPWTWTYQAFNTFGVTAPVGVAVSWGHRVLFISTGEKGWTKKGTCAGWSSSIFVSLVDIGALAAFRFSDDSTQHAPTIQLQDIISPGIFYSLGIPKTPLSFNVGWQIGPLLREVTAKTTSYKNNYTRFSISLCVDIPIVNFYSRPRKN